MLSALDISKLHDADALGVVAAASPWGPAEVEGMRSGEAGEFAWGAFQWTSA